MCRRGRLLIAVVVRRVGLLTQLHRQAEPGHRPLLHRRHDSDIRFTEQIDAETAVRGYALTGDQATLAATDELFGTRATAAHGRADAA